MRPVFCFGEGMAIPVICGLRTEIVPHRQWAVSKWFYANELWYYHRLGTDEEVVTGRKFYQLVDEDVRELCHVLHEAGLQTTPSCQGHFYDRSRFEKIWQELVRETVAIRGEGLSVKDSETQKSYLFREDNYRLPWDRFELFYDQASAQQGIGYLGIIVPPDRDDLLERVDVATFCDHKAELKYDAILSKLLRGHVFNVFVRSGGPGEREELWRMVTNLLQRALSTTTSRVRVA
jgi:hypothetical protein